MNLILSLKHARPDGQWVLNGGYETLEWLPQNTTSKPTLQELENAWNQIKDEVAWRPIRAERAKRLASSDWSMLPDVKVSRPYWENYRQALRDIPQRYAKPEDVVWPQEPQ